MTLFEQLQRRKGGLIRIKTQLFWYNRRGWDDNPGRVCLVLDASCDPRVDAVADCVSLTSATLIPTVALLLIDGLPQWIWVNEKEVELIDDPT